MGVFKCGIVGGGTETIDTASLPSLVSIGGLFPAHHLLARIRLMRLKREGTECRNVKAGFSTNVHEA